MEFTVSDEALMAAARVLDKEGRFYRWWPVTLAKFDELDSIGKEEFLAITWRVLKAAHEVENSNTQNIQK